MKRHFALGIVPTLWLPMFVGGEVTGLIVQLEAAEDAQTQNLAKDAAAYIERASDRARESLQEVRRSVHALRPLVLAGKGIKDRVESMGGELTVRSAPGNGTAILVFLPLPNYPPLLQL
jgi:signal transduction histidine kinase